MKMKDVALKYSIVLCAYDAMIFNSNGSRGNLINKLFDIFDIYFIL